MFVRVVEILSKYADVAKRKGKGPLLVKEYLDNYDTDSKVNDGLHDLASVQNADRSLKTESALSTVERGEDTLSETSLVTRWPVIV